MNAVGSLSSNETCREKAAEILDTAMSNFSAKGVSKGQAQAAIKGGEGKGNAKGGKGKNKGGKNRREKKEKTEEEKKTDELNRKIRESLGYVICIFV